MYVHLRYTDIKIFFIITIVVHWIISLEYIDVNFDFGKN